MKPELKRILDCLNLNEMRATYTAVQSAMGIPVLEKINWSELLGERRPYTSWIVEKESGMPIGYRPHQLHPKLQTKPKILTKGRQIKELLVETPSINVADCLGNNCAVICPNCSKAYCVSGFLNKKDRRKCPHCGESEISFPEAKAIWETVHSMPVVENEQTATRLTFKQKWLGHDVWVTFTEDGITYRYPHDQILQTLINQMGVIKGTKSWEQKDGYYNFPRLSDAQKKILERYILG